MVRVRRKCAVSRKTEVLGSTQSLSPSASQKKNEPKESNEFQGKLSHSSPARCRSKDTVITRWYASNQSSNMAMAFETNQQLPDDNLEGSQIANKLEYNAVCKEETQNVVEEDMPEGKNWCHGNKTIVDSLHISCHSEVKLRSNGTTCYRSKSENLNCELLPVDHFKLVQESCSEFEPVDSKINVVPNCHHENHSVGTQLSEMPTTPLKVEVQNNVESDVLKVPTTCMSGNGISPTPHKIQIHNEKLIAQSPSSALSSLHISATPKKAVKSRRRLNPSQTSNQQTGLKSYRPTQAEMVKQEIASKCHKIDEYFPIRRSNRKTKRTIFEEKQLQLEQAIKEDREDGLEIHNFEGKGRGVVTTRLFSRGEFVVEYRGELIDMGEAKQREVMYTQDQNTGCYMYYFKYRNQQYCIDATKESGRLGRLVNHSRNGNLITKTVPVGNEPHLVLIAKEDIPKGEEIMYDYGDRSKESLRYHPWLNC